MDSASRNLEPNNFAGPRYEPDESTSEVSPLLPTMVAEKVSISQQVLVSQSSLSRSRKSTQYLAALIATIGGLIAGTSLGWTSPTSDSLQNGIYGFNISKDEMAWIGSFMPLGAIVGSIIVASLVNLLGRKNLILLLVVPSVIGWSSMAFANSVSAYPRLGIRVHYWILTLLVLDSYTVIMFCIGRFLTGLATGSYCILVPMYTAEIAEKDIRGSLGTYLQLQITIGILFIYVVGSFLSVYHLTLICAAIPLIYALLMSFLPETPYFHLMKGNIPAAKHSMAWFRGPNYDSQSELLVIQQNIDKDEAEKVPFLHAFQTTAAKRGLIIGLGVMFLQQFSGCNAVIFYTKSIFQDAGATINSNMSTIIVGIVQVITTWIASLVVDKLGRRVLLLLSIVVMTLCTFTLGLYFYLKNDAHLNVTDIAWLPLLSLSGYIIVFSLGFGPIPWMLMGEIFPSKIKGAASSLACLFNWTCVFLITKLFPLFVSWFGSGVTFWCFTVCSGIGIFFVMLVVPETKGKTLEEVQAMLGGDDVPPVMPANQFIVGPAFGETKVKV